MKYLVCMRDSWEESGAFYPDTRSHSARCLWRWKVASDRVDSNIRRYTWKYEGEAREAKRTSDKESSITEVNQVAKVAERE